MNKYKRHINSWMIGVFIVLLLNACVNDINKVKKIVVSPDSPEQTSENLHIIYTDSGIAQIEIFAVIAESYLVPKEVTQFKDGLKVNFYNDSGQVKSTLTSLYGEIDKASGNIAVRDSVKLVNIEDGRTLETEALYWNKNGDSIFTDKPVVITSKDMILYGIGAWTTPDFDTAQIFNPTAKIFTNQ